eukprot:10168667-Lingulodinium_polyedra.AAC.1
MHSEEHSTPWSDPEQTHISHAKQAPHNSPTNCQSTCTCPGTQQHACTPAKQCVCTAERAISVAILAPGLPRAKACQSCWGSSAWQPLVRQPPPLAVGQLPGSGGCHPRGWLMTSAGWSPSRATQTESGGRRISWQPSRRTMSYCVWC